MVQKNVGRVGQRQLISKYDSDEFFSKLSNSQREAIKKAQRKYYKEYPERSVVIR